jgi:glutathione S-transferase
MHLKLVSFALCPYVQRAVVLLEEKKAAHETVYIDLRNKPPWFLDISPRGKVPVLIADGTPLFESQAICEFLEEVYPEPRLMPIDPIGRARDRAWFAYAEDLLAPIFVRSTATDRASYDEAPTKISERLARLQQELGDRQWLSGNGTRFGMADVALTPAFTRIDILERLGSYSIPAELAAIRRWSERILAREAVKRSVPADFEAQGLAAMRERGALAVARVA